MIQYCWASVLDLLHARKVSQLNLQFKFAQFLRYPNFASLNTYANPLCPTYKIWLPSKTDKKIHMPNLQKFTSDVFKHSL